jgi:dihydroflavonol-4-reductase
MIVQRMMDGAIPGCPQRWFGVVDVRDVADLHVRAMTDPAAAGERFIAVGDGFKTILEMARILRERMGAAAARVPTRQLPDWLVRLAALWDPGVRTIATELGKRKNADHDKAARLLGWSPRPDPDAIVATAESLGRFGLLKDDAGNSAD